MSPRDTLKSGLGEGRGERQTSVVGSRVSDTTSSLWSRRLPRGGIRGNDDLKVPDANKGDAAFGSSSRGSGRGRSFLRIIAILSGTLVLLLLAASAGLFVLSRTSAFEIKNVQSYDTDHITAESVAALVELEPGATLLNIDDAAIEKSVMKNPWVKSVLIERNFPDTLRIICRERTPSALVTMGTGGIAWLLSSDGVWVEPMRIHAAANESTADVALKQAADLGVVLIMDVPATVSPVAGSEATDEAIEAVWTYQEQLSKPFLDEVVAISASSEDDISCILKSGVEVSFGSTSSIENKERVAKQILDSYSGQVTYINVRVPSHPTYRRVNSNYVREGTGALGSAVDETPLFGNKEEEGTEGQEGETQEGGEATEGGTETTSADATGTEGDYSYDTDSNDYDYSYDEGYDYGYDESYAYDEGYGYDEGYAYDEYGYTDESAYY